jgi:hypothetical protein
MDALTIAEICIDAVMLTCFFLLGVLALWRVVTTCPCDPCSCCLRHRELAPPPVSKPARWDSGRFTRFQVVVLIAVGCLVRALTFGLSIPSWASWVNK